MSEAIDHPLEEPRETIRYWLTTSDGVGIDAVLLRGSGPRTTAVVLANGFTGTYRNPSTRDVAEALLPLGDVMTFDFRGHHGSGGRSTVGNEEIHDLEAVLVRLRELGYTRVSVVGFSMGAAVAIRHTAIFGGTDAVVAVSGPSRWYYRGTRPMRLLHMGIEGSVGRLFLRGFHRVRVTNREWDPLPAEPRELAGRISPTPLLVVHGDADTYFPVSHAREIHDAAREPRELWIVRGMGHAERAVTPELAVRVREWLAERIGSKE